MPQKMDSTGAPPKPDVTIGPPAPELEPKPEPKPEKPKPEQVQRRRGVDQKTFDKILQVKKPETRVPKKQDPEEESAIQRGLQQLEKTIPSYPESPEDKIKTGHALAEDKVPRAVIMAAAESGIPEADFVDAVNTLSAAAQPNVPWFQRGIASNGEAMWFNPFSNTTMTYQEAKKYMRLHEPKVIAYWLNQEVFSGATPKMLKHADEWFNPQGIASLMDTLGNSKSFGADSAIEIFAMAKTASLFLTPSQVELFNQNFKLLEMDPESKFSGGEKERMLGFMAAINFAQAGKVIESYADYEKAAFFYNLEPVEGGGWSFGAEERARNGEIINTGEVGRITSEMEPVIDYYFGYEALKKLIRGDELTPSEAMGYERVGRELAIAIFSSVEGDPRLINQYQQEPLEALKQHIWDRWIIAAKLEGKSDAEIFGANAEAARSYSPVGAGIVPEPLGLIEARRMADASHQDPTEKALFNLTTEAEQRFLSSDAAESVDTFLGEKQGVALRAMVGAAGVKWDPRKQNPELYTSLKNQMFKAQEYHMRAYENTQLGEGESVLARSTPDAVKHAAAGVWNLWAAQVGALVAGVNVIPAAVWWLGNQFGYAGTHLYYNLSGGLGIDKSEREALEFSYQQRGGLNPWNEESAAIVAGDTTITEILQERYHYPPAIALAVDITSQIMFDPALLAFRGVTALSSAKTYLQRAGVLDSWSAIRTVGRENSAAIRDLIRTVSPSSKFGLGEKIGYTWGEYGDTLWVLNNWNKRRSEFIKILDGRTIEGMDELALQYSDELARVAENQGVKKGWRGASHYDPLRQLKYTQRGAVKWLDRGGHILGNDSRLGSYINRSLHTTWSERANQFTRTAHKSKLLGETGTFNELIVKAINRFMAEKGLLNEVGEVTDRARVLLEGDHARGIKPYGSGKVSTPGAPPKQILRETVEEFTTTWFDDFVSGTFKGPWGKAALSKDFQNHVFKLVMSAKLNFGSEVITDADLINILDELFHSAVRGRTVGSKLPEGSVLKKYLNFINDPEVRAIYNTEGLTPPSPWNVDHDALEVGLLRSRTPVGPGAPSPGRYPTQGATRAPEKLASNILLEAERLHELDQGLSFDELAQLAADTAGLGPGASFRPFADALNVIVEHVEAGYGQLFLPQIRSQGLQATVFGAIPFLEGLPGLKGVTSGLKWAKRYMGSTVPRMVVEFGDAPTVVADQLENIMRRWKWFTPEEITDARMQMLDILSEAVPGKEIPRRAQAMALMLEMQEVGIVRLAEKRGITDAKALNGILSATYERVDKFNASLFGISEDAAGQLRKLGATGTLEDFEKALQEGGIVMHVKDKVQAPLLETDLVRQFALVDPVMVQGALDEAIGMTRSLYARFETIMGKTADTRRTFNYISGPPPAPMINGQVWQRAIGDVFKGLVGWFKYMAILSPRYLFRVPLMDEQMRMLADVGLMETMLSRNYTGELIRKVAPDFAAGRLGNEYVALNIAGEQKAQLGEMLSQASGGRLVSWDDFLEKVNQLYTDGFTLQRINEIELIPQWMQDLALEQLFGPEGFVGFMDDLKPIRKASIDEILAGEKSPKAAGLTSKTREEVLVTGHKGPTSFMNPYEPGAAFENSAGKIVPALDADPVISYTSRASKIDIASPRHTIHHELAHEIMYGIDDLPVTEKNVFYTDLAGAIAADAKKSPASKGIRKAFNVEPDQDPQSVVGRVLGAELQIDKYKYATKGGTHHIEEGFAHLWAIHKQDPKLFQTRYPHIASIFGKHKELLDNIANRVYSPEAVLHYKHQMVDVLPRKAILQQKTVHFYVDNGFNQQELENAIGLLKDQYGDEVFHRRIVIEVNPESGGNTRLNEATLNRVKARFKAEGIDVKVTNETKKPNVVVSIGPFKGKKMSSDSIVHYRPGDAIPEVQGSIDSPILGSTSPPLFLGQPSASAMRVRVPWAQEIIDINEANSGLMHSFFQRSSKSIQDDLGVWRYGPSRGRKLDPSREEWTEIKYTPSVTGKKAEAYAKWYDSNRRYVYGGGRWDQKNYTYFLSWERSLRMQFRNSKLGRYIAELKAKNTDEAFAGTLAKRFLLDNEQLMIDLGIHSPAAAAARAQEAVTNGYHLMPTQRIAELTLTDTGGVWLQKELANYPDQLAKTLDEGERLENAMPIVHGKLASPTTAGGQGQLGSSLINAFGRYLFEAPTNLLNRQPMAKFYYRKAYRTFLEQAKAEGVVVTPEMKIAMEVNAKQFAVERVKDVLFDFQAQSRFMEMSSVIFPFMQPYAEAIVVWGRLLAENPEFGYLAVKTYNGMKSAGWVTNDPQTGQSRIRVPIFSWLLAQGLAIADPTKGNFLTKGSEFTLPVDSLNFVFNQTLEIPLGGSWRLPIPVPSMSPPAMAFMQWLGDKNIDKIPGPLRLTYINWAYQYGSQRNTAEMFANMLVPRWAKLISDGVNFALGDPMQTEGTRNAAANRMIERMAGEGITVDRLVNDPDFARDMTGQVFKAKEGQSAGYWAEKWIVDTARDAASALSIYMGVAGQFFPGAPMMNTEDEPMEREFNDLLEKLEEENPGAPENYERAVQTMENKYPDSQAFWMSKRLSPQGINPPMTEVAIHAMNDPLFDEIAQINPQVAMSLVVELDNQAAGTKGAEYNPAISAMLTANGWSNIKPPEEFVSDINTERAFDKYREASFQWRMFQDWAAENNIKEGMVTYDTEQKAFEQVKENLMTISPGFKDAMENISLNKGVDPDIMIDLKMALNNEAFAKTPVGQALDQYLGLMGKYEAMMRDAHIYDITSKGAFEYIPPGVPGMDSPQISLGDQWQIDVELLKASSAGFTKLWQLYLTNSLTDISSAGEKALEGLSDAQKKEYFTFEMEMGAQQKIITNATNEFEKAAAYNKMSDLIRGESRAYGLGPQAPTVIWWESQTRTEQQSYVTNMATRAPFFLNEFERSYILGMETNEFSEDIWGLINDTYTMQTQIEQQFPGDPTQALEAVKQQRIDIINSAVTRSAVFAEQVYNLNLPGWKFFEGTGVAEQPADQGGDSWQALRESLAQIAPYIMAADIYGSKDTDASKRLMFQTYQSIILKQIEALKANDPNFETQWQYYEKINGADLLTRVFIPDPYYVMGNPDTWTLVQLSMAKGTG